MFYDVAITSRKDKKQKSQDEGEDDDDEDEDDELERNPVEWLMVTRSDPGGGIPRFMVERNTPASITADANKFAEWAVKGEGIPSEDEFVQEKEAEAPANAAAAGSNADF